MRFLSVFVVSFAGGGGRWRKVSDLAVLDELSERDDNDNAGAQHSASSPREKDSSGMPTGSRGTSREVGWGAITEAGSLFFFWCI